METRIERAVDEADPISWFLRSRGIQVGSAVASTRRMFLLLRLDRYELTFLAHEDAMLTDDVRSGFRKALEMDAALPEFALVWAAAGPTYSQRFRHFVDGAIAAASLGTPAPE